MTNLKETLQKQVKGEVHDSKKLREQYSHDASIFELVPEVIVEPKDSQDVQALVRYVAKHKAANPELSLTARSAGTCMSGGSITQSILVRFTKHFNAIEHINESEARVQPGVYYRDFERETLKQGVFMPSYPASRDLCTVGGMVSNNSGGEKSLKYGKTEKFVNSLQVVFADGKEYTVKPLTKKELVAKMGQKDFEGKLYSQIFHLIERNYEAIKAAKPNVTKDSTGYHLWNVWDRETGIFDLTQLIVGSQGTLGFVTDITFRMVPHQPYSGTLVMFLRDTKDLGTLITDVMKYKPTAFEGFDNYTLMLSFKLFFYFHQALGWRGMAKLGIQLIPDALKLSRGIPKMVLLIEFDGTSAQEVADKVHLLRQNLHKYDHKSLFEEDPSEASAKKFWIMRRESFNLLRKKIHDKHTAPFMDDLVVQYKDLPEFLPRIRNVITRYKLLATIAGHMGDGNFHIIPLMKIEDPTEKAKLEPAMKEINKIVLEYGGSLSGEHNDGMIRGPWLGSMYGQEVLDYFKEVKHIFDPDNIFNPHKKTDADWDFSMSHVRETF